MLRADLTYADLDAPAALAGGGISLRGSFLEPLSHRMLATRIVESDGLLAVFTGERFAGDPEGLSHRRAASDAALQAIVRAWRDHPLDWSVLTIDRKRRAVRYRSSAIASAPVFLVADSERVAIDWDYARLLRRRGAEIEWEAATAYLAGTASYGPRTMVKDLWRSTAGAELRAQAGRVTARLPAASLCAAPGRLAEGVDPAKLLRETVEALVAARPIECRRTAVEISGGMDSALVALAAANVAGPGLLSTGAQFSGAMGAAQRRRRRLLCRHGGFDDLELPAERFAPFSPASPRRRRFGVWPQDESYPEIFDAIFGLLAKAGIDTLISGFGGDELYPAFEGEEDAASDPVAAPPASPFLTAPGNALAARADGRYPPGPLQETCWQAAAARAQRLLRHGIWPVYPYHAPDLARFVASLPWEYRRDRALLRKTLTELLGNPVFEHAYVKESFRDVAIGGIAGNRAYLTDLLRRSPIVRDDLVRREEAVEALGGDVAALPADAFNALFQLLAAACFFDGVAPPDPGMDPNRFGDSEI